MPAAIDHEQFALMVVEDVTWTVADRFSADDCDVEHHEIAFGAEVNMRLFNRMRRYRFSLRTEMIDDAVPDPRWKMMFDIDTRDKTGTLLKKTASCDTLGVIEHDEYISAFGDESYEIEATMMTVLSYAVRTFIIQLNDAAGSSA